MNQQPDVKRFAESMLQLLQRFTGNRPDALAQMREQVENELAAGKDLVARAQAQLAALEQLEAIIVQRKPEQLAAFVPTSAPPLKKAILTVLSEDTDVVWIRDDLYAELIRRGWGPGGAKPRNTFTARLRDLELEGKAMRVGEDDGFTVSTEGGESD